MKTNEILNAIDDEISKLQQARAILAGTVAPNKTSAEPTRRPGRPKGSGIKSVVEATATVPAKNAKKKGMSAEGKARIAAAQKARWAAKKKAAAKERAAKRPTAKPAKAVAKAASKRPAKPAVKTSSPNKAKAVKKAAEPQAEVAATIA